MQLTRKALVAVAIVAAVAIGGGVAVAQSGGKAGGPGASVAGAVPGYRYVSSAFVANPNNAQTFGSVFCPANEPVTGGGVFGSSASVNQEINSSYPLDGGDADNVSDDGWGAYVNNHSGLNSSFQVWAVCRIPSP